MTIRRFSQGRSAISSGNRLVLRCVFACMPCATLAAAPADDALSPPGQIEEVTVTAQRRAENIQNVPVAVTAITGEKLQAAGISSTLDLGTVTPGLEVGNALGSILPHIRGIGTTSHGPSLENSVATYVDDIYYASESASIFKLTNIAQIEVLKGPQGTLFGRNATGGVIQVKTADPESGFSGKASAQYANYQTLGGSLYLTGGTQTLRADVAAYGSHQGEGYGRNLFNGQDVYQTDQDVAVRSKWLFQPTDSTQARLILDYARTIGNQFATIDAAPGTVAVFNPAGHSGGPYDIDQSFQPRGATWSSGASLKVDHDFGSLGLVSITGWRRSELDLAFDVAFAPFPVITVSKLVDEERQFTEELQLKSASGSRIQWVAGLYYFDATGIYDPSEVSFASFVAPPLAKLDIYSNQGTRSVAGFAQASTEILPDTNLTLGARYTHERRDFRAAETGSLSGDVSIGNLMPPVEGARKNADKATYRVALDHRFNASVFGYASFSTGFKSGGFNSGVPSAPPFAPETLNAFEVGTKLDLLERRLRFNPSAFYYTYKNIQVEQPILGQVYYYNGAAAKLYGLDADLTALVTQSLTVSAGIALLHSQFTSFPNAIINTQLPTGGTHATTGPADGNALPYAPQRTATITADYAIPIALGRVTANATYSYNSGYFTQADNILKQPAYSLLNASLTWEIAHSATALELWGRNLTDKHVASSLQPSAISSLIEYGPPRTYGVEVSTRF